MSKVPLPFSDQSISDWIALVQQSKDAEKRFRALQAIRSLCPPHEVAEWAARCLVDADSTVRALAAKLCGNSGSVPAAQTETQLVALLADADPDVRFESARTLIRVKSPHWALTVPVLLSFLDELETQPLMIAAVIHALVEADGPASTIADELRPRLQRLLDHERAEVREAVATAVAMWPSMAVGLGGQLLPLLDDSEPIVREKIAQALGRAGVVNDQIKAALETARQDEDSEVAREAQEALKALNLG
jgi:HEAT repeat protein